MAAEKHSIHDRDIQLLIGNILRYGVYISLLLTLIGGVINLWHHGGEHIGDTYKVFHEKDDSMWQYIKEAAHGAFSGKGIAIASCGILVLLFTPTLRLLCSLWGFIMEKDKMYILITLIVLTIIAISINGGLG